jgi:hypothetical protein
MYKNELLILFFIAKMVLSRGVLQHSERFSEESVLYIIIIIIVRFQTGSNWR